MLLYRNVIQVRIYYHALLSLHSLPFAMLVKEQEVRTKFNIVSKRHFG